MKKHPRPFDMIRRADGWLWICGVCSLVSEPVPHSTTLDDYMRAVHDHVKTHAPVENIEPVARELMSAAKRRVAKKRAA